MAFGYIPDYRGKSLLKDLYLGIVGYPYPPRRNEAALVLRLLAPKKDEKILDIGCGDGVWYNELIKRGFSVTGIDLSDHDLGKLKERAEKIGIVPHVFKANAQKMPFNSASFDKVYSICTFEHIENDHEAFAEASRVLRPGGYFIISIPMKETPLLTRIALKMPLFIKKTIYNGLVANANTAEEYLENFNKNYNHYRNYTMEDIATRVENNGFAIEKKTYNCRLLGSCIWSFYHTLKIFERKKYSDTDYEFKNELAFAAIAPLFYSLMLFDRLLFWTKGRIIVLKLKKK